MKLRTLPLAAMLVLAASGCSPTDSHTAASGSGSQTPRSYAEVDTDFVNGPADYAAFTFTAASGDCASQGLPETLTYSDPGDLGYFTLSSPAGYEDDNVSATETTLSFAGLTIAGQSASCAISAAAGDSTGSVGCFALGSDMYNPQSLCSGTVTVTATPR